MLFYYLMKKFVIIIGIFFLLAGVGIRLRPLTPTAYPIANFGSGITKKPFGIYITPQNSPVQPERFQGYHTGVDIETAPADLDKEIPVFAITGGVVALSQTASGYGGVIAIRHIIKGQNVLAIYGHLAPASLAEVGTRVSAGEKIGILGKAYSRETDGERKHLHFGLYKGADVNITGYVQNKEQLANWLDPQEFFKSAW